MTNLSQETLIKAIEIADGWYLTTDGYYSAPDVVGASIERMNQVAKDALAAQLVRQMHTNSQVMVLIFPSSTTILVEDEEIAWAAQLSSQAENTINAIVESGVLDQGPKST